MSMKSSLSPKKAGKSENEMSDFVLRYTLFKDFKKMNAASLRVLNDIETMVHKPATFDYDKIVDQCERLVVIVNDMSSQLAELSRDRHANLPAIAKKIGRSVLKELRAKPKLERSNWTIPLANLSHEKSSLVGNKAANLADIANRVNLPTPMGFTVTAFSCHHFFQQAGIYEKLRRKLRHLNVRDTERLEKVCAEIKSLILQSPLPDSIACDIFREARLLSSEFGENLRFAVRSSASGEDSASSSFAGQFETVLNVSTENLVLAYKEVVAGMFNPRAVFYRRGKGYRDIDDLMSVLCVTMVDAVSSGCMYTIDPNYHVADNICINANWGLGVSVVDGSARTDYWRICRESKKILVEEIPAKDTMLVMGSEKQLLSVAVPLDRRNIPCLNPQQLHTLTDYGLKLEKHFSVPLDIEWALDGAGKIIILQARPLPRVTDEVPIEELEKQVHASVERILIQAGMTAAPGAASGPAYILESIEGLAAIPEGSILVARQTSPALVTAMAKVKGIVTDVGSVTGHMASVAREFKIPTLVGTENGTRVIQPGQIITLDATRRAIYQGEVSAVLKAKAPVNLIADSPLYIRVRSVLTKVVPLNLIDPRSEDFIPERCASLHDVIRFAHEMAMREMFDLGVGLMGTEGRRGRRLRNTPLNVFVLDLGRGICKSPTANDDPSEATVDVFLDQIASIPFKALLKGVTHKKVLWSKKIHVNNSMVNLGSSTSVVSESSMQDDMGEPSYAIISKRYLNFNAKIGYHYVTIDSFCCEEINSNYVALSFKGGAADVGLRTRRAELMAIILIKMGFLVEHKGDLLKAEMRKYDIDRLTEKLDQIGRLLGSVRRLDMVLSDNEELSWYEDEFFKGNYSFEQP
jgi:pyruvate,water dikinase